MRQLIIRILAVSAASLLASCCKSDEPVQLNVIPYPESVTKLSNGTFDGVTGASIRYNAAFSEKTVESIRQFAERLSSATGEESTVKKGRFGALNIRHKASLAEEEYEISIRRNCINVFASSHKGVLYSLATLSQMLPVEVYSGVPAPEGTDWTLPCVSIKDKPRFGYRGLLHDSGRHLFSVDEIKKVLDIMAVYKLNVMHWHLTEDQGWRIQIDKYPELTEKAAWRNGTQIGRDKNTNDGIRYGGYYTKDQVREIVDYADRLGIEIIPEIDLPGHMLAALSVLPELGCTGGPYEVWTHWGVSPDVLCPGKEATFKFLEDVLGEVADLFPSEYFHIGGDECPKIRWKECPDCQALIAKLGLKDDENTTAEQKLQVYVSSRVQKFLATKGKKIIGWDEILEGEPEEGAIIMSWRGSKGGIAAAERGYDAIMTPYQYLYIDYAQVPLEEEYKEPLAMEGNLPIEQVYSYEPLEGIPEEQQHHILGVQTNLWTEYIATPEYLEYMLLPRLAAASELQWCQKENKDLDRLLNDLKTHQFRIYDALNYNYCKVIIGIYGGRD